MTDKAFSPETGKEQAKGSVKLKNRQTGTVACLRDRGLKQTVKSFPASLAKSVIFPSDCENFTFIDLFAGIGGLRAGFDGIGGNCVFTSEENIYCHQTYRANFNCNHEIAGDITQIHAADIPAHDLLLAGFPCQPFSIAGVSRRNSLGRPHGFRCESQGTLFFEVARIIAHHRPKAFVLENVKNLLGHDRGQTFQVIHDTLKIDLGYTLHWRVIDARSLVPQHRERLFMVGFRVDNAFDFNALVLPSSASEPKLASILHPEDGTEISDGHYTTGKLGQVAEKYTLTDRLWNYLQSHAQKHRAAGNGFGFSLVGPDDVSRTLSARYGKDGSEILIKQENKPPRRLTPRECARLMGFDQPGQAVFNIPVSDTQAYRQFGNAVVVPVSKLIACYMKPFLRLPDRLEEPGRLKAKLLGESHRPYRVLKATGEQAYKVAELFSGAGGLALGMHNAGLGCELLVEIDKNAVATLKKNKPDWPVIQDDIAHVDFKNIKADVVAGGFPCQPFSYAGKKLGFEDTRGTLFFEFARAVRQIKPGVIVGENVRGLEKHDKGRTLSTMLQILDDLGYRVSHRLLRAQYLDVAQKRERLVILGVRKELKSPIAFPKEQDYMLGLREALHGVPISDGQRYTKKKYKIMDLVPPGGYWRDLPEAIKKEYMGASYFLGGGQTGMARRLAWDEPSLTLTCNPAQKQTERCHPSETRPLTIREYARIQSFPDEWVFEGSISAQYRQIGNAVPVNLGYHIGRCVIAMLSNTYDPVTMDIV